MRFVWITAILSFLVSGEIFAVERTIPTSTVDFSQAVSFITEPRIDQQLWELREIILGLDENESPERRPQFLRNYSLTDQPAWGAVVERVMMTTSNLMSFFPSISEKSFVNGRWALPLEMVHPIRSLQETISVAANAEAPIGWWPVLKLIPKKKLTRGEKQRASDPILFWTSPRKSYAVPIVGVMRPLYGYTIGFMLSERPWLILDAKRKNSNGAVLITHKNIDDLIAPAEGAAKLALSSRAQTNYRKLLEMTFPRDAGGIYQMSASGEMAFTDEKSGVSVSLSPADGGFFDYSSVLDVKNVISARLSGRVRYMGENRPWTNHRTASTIAVKIR